MDNNTYSITKRLADLTQQLKNKRHELKILKKVDCSYEEYKTKEAIITNRIFELEEQFAYILIIQY